MKDHYPTGTVRVTADTFVRAVTDITLARVVRDAGLAAFNHFRQPPRMDNQPVIRMNQDTLYSMAVLDLSTPATLVLPDCGGRYMSAQIISQDHYSTDFLHEPGEHLITAESVGARYAAVNVRFFVNINDKDDLLAVNALQDQLRIEQADHGKFEVPDWNYDSFVALRNDIQPLARHLKGIDGMFGPKDTVDPIVHMIGAAVGWGGLPSSESVYFTHAPKPGNEDKLHALTVGDVPCDAFWSVTMYNKLGFMEANPQNVQSFNNATVERNPDGSATIHLGPGGEGHPNYLPSPGEGWNYLVRVYLPHDIVLNGSWRFPTATPVE